MALMPFGYDADASAAWYAQLEKPFFAPPSWLFGPVWTVLYVSIILVFGYVIARVWRGTLPRAVLIPLALNAVSNLAFTPLQFGLRSNVLAFLDILLVLGSLVWLMLMLKEKAPRAALALVPYLLWVAFATALQASVTVLNA